MPFRLLLGFYIELSYTNPVKSDIVYPDMLQLGPNERMNASMSHSFRTPRSLLALFVALAVAFCCPAYSPVLAESTAVSAYNAENPGSLSAVDIEGTTAVLMDYDTGRVLFSKDSDQVMFPASTTKIMTALLALEYGHLNDMVTISDEAKNVPSDSSRVPVTPGEEMPFIDLLYGLMMRSGNDAAMAVAVIVGGSVSGFVDMMNAKAAELGCKNTHFVNPHGYHDANHYTTAYDLALIAREAMKNPTFREIVSARSYVMTATSQREKLRLATSNALFVEGNSTYYEYADGIKTGYHSKAGQCFVGSATMDGARLISVTLQTSKTGRWEDTRRMMRYGFLQFRKYSFNDLYAAAPIYASIQNADTDDPGTGLLAMTVVPGGSVESYSITCLPEEFDAQVAAFTPQLQVNYSKQLRAPIYTGDIMGTVTLTTEDGQQLSGTLIASRDVAELQQTLTLHDLFPWLDTINFNLLWLLVALIVLIILLAIALRIRRAIVDRRRRREMLRRRREAYRRYRSRR